MICPKCQTQHAESIMSWTISGRKLTMPQLRLWGCANLECRHQWPRESTSPTESPASYAHPDPLSQEVPYGPSMGCTDPQP
jgi:hypothetical protein